MLGGLFAGNYFGGEVGKLQGTVIFKQREWQGAALALQLREATRWSEAVEAANSSRMYSVVDPETGELSGTIRSLLAPASIISSTT